MEVREGTMFLVGWKEFARASGFHVRTLKRWHYELKPIPFQKTSPNPRGKNFITIEEFKHWLSSIPFATIRASRHP